MNWQRWTFRILDTCFFRGGLPYNAGEGGFTTVQGTFPPYMTTLQGAVRTALAWEQGWSPEGGDSWPALLGGADDIGSLCLRGPYLVLEDQEDEPLFRMPFVLLEKAGNFVRLVPGEPVECDLGLVRLPKPARTLKGAALPEDTYVSLSGLVDVLKGGVPGQNEVWYKRELWAEEPRVGLALEDSTRTARTGMLYSITHVRPERKLRLVVLVAGVPDTWDLVSRRVGWLGGEGRLVEIEVQNVDDPLKFLPYPPDLSPGPDGILRFTVTLITPGYYPYESLPEVIRGGPPGVPGHCVSACIGRAERVGGWDLKNGQPRPLEPLLPAGSTWFYEAEAADLEAVRGLHGSCLGDKAVFGFGQVLIGRWMEEGSR